MYQSTKRIRNLFIVTGVLFVLFIAFVVCLLNIDRVAIGPENSVVGFSTINSAFYDTVGLNMMLYDITKIIGFVAELLAVGFGVFGLIQLIKRKSIKKIDADILILGGFYVLIIAAYVLFEVIVINYRPVILDEGLEASFPSSHTMLGFCIMSTAIMQFSNRIHNNLIKNIVIIFSFIIAVVIVVGRLMSGVHWLTDIMGGLLIGTTLVMLYYSSTEYVKYRKKFK